MNHQIITHISGLLAVVEAILNSVDRRLYEKYSRTIPYLGELYKVNEDIHLESIGNIKEFKTYFKWKIENDSHFIKKDNIRLVGYFPEAKDWIQVKNEDYYSKFQGGPEYYQTMEGWGLLTFQVHRISLNEFGCVMAMDKGYSHQGQAESKGWKIIENKMLNLFKFMDEVKCEE